jgi:hypothetical protein
LRSQLNSAQKQQSLLRKTHPCWATTKTRLEFLRPIKTFCQTKIFKYQKNTPYRLLSMGLF